MRAFGWFVISALYAVAAQQIAQHAARGFTTGDAYEAVNLGIVLFLLVCGFALMGMVGQRQHKPLQAMGLMRRPGWTREIAIGAALGWGGVVAAVLPIALFGSLYVSYTLSAHQLLLLVYDILAIAAGACAEELIFRGYPFQRLIEALGPVLATLFISVMFGVAHFWNADASSASLFTTVLAGWLLALAYLRTRALWVGLGFHFAWNAVMAALFGLPLSGTTGFSPIISTYTAGPVWLTGGGYGPEASAITIFVLLALIFVQARATSELKYRYATSVIVGAGMPVDIDAAARRQHEAAMGPEQATAGQGLVQILAPPPPAPLPARLPEIDKES